MSKSHKYLKKENYNGKVRYIYTESDIAKHSKVDISCLEAKQRGGLLAGEKYRKAIEFFINTRTTLANESADRSGERSDEKFIEHCKKNNLWRSKIGSISPHNFIDKGSETNVYGFGDRVMKQMTTILHSHFDSPLEDMLERIAHYNSIFPESFLKIHGFGEYEFEGEERLSVMCIQPFVRGLPTPIKEIEAFMRSKGFKKDPGGNTYYNASFIIDDLHSKNVLKDSEGNYFVIDAIIEKNNEQGWKKIEGEQ